MIYETDIPGLHSWVEFVRSRDAIPAGVSVYDCEDRPTFAALALPNRRQLAWDFTTHSELYQFNIYSNTMHSREFKLSLFSSYQITPRSGIISHFRKTEDIIHQSFGIDLPAMHATLEKIQKSAYRLIYLAGYPTKDGRRFAVISSSPSLYPQRYAYELTFDALKVFATCAKADGYLPISLTASAVGETSAFSIVLEQVPDRGCELSFGLTQDALASEFDRRRAADSRQSFSAASITLTRFSLTSAGFKDVCRRDCKGSVAMRHIRFPIAGLMLTVLVAAVGLAALRNASEVWAGVAFLTTCAVLCLAIVGVVCRGGADRAVVARFCLIRLGLSAALYVDDRRFADNEPARQDRGVARRAGSIQRRHGRRNWRRFRCATCLFIARDRPLPLGGSSRPFRGFCLPHPLRRINDTRPISRPVDANREPSSPPVVALAGRRGGGRCTVYLDSRPVRLEIVAWLLGRHHVFGDMRITGRDDPGCHRRSGQAPADLARRRNFRDQLHGHGLWPLDRSGDMAQPADRPSSAKPSPLVSSVRQWVPHFIRRRRRRERADLGDPATARADAVPGGYAA